MRFDRRLLQRSPTTARFRRGLRRLTLHGPPHHRTGDRIPHLYARLLDFLEERSQGRRPRVQLQNDLLRNLFYEAT